MYNLNYLHRTNDAEVIAISNNYNELKLMAAKLISNYRSYGGIVKTYDFGGQWYFNNDIILDDGTILESGLLTINNVSDNLNLESEWSNKL